MTRQFSVRFIDVVPH